MGIKPYMTATLIAPLPPHKRSMVTGFMEYKTEATNEGKGSRQKTFLRRK